MAKKALTDNSLKILNVLKELGNKNATAKDIGEMLGMPTRSVDAAVTSGLVKKGLAKRVAAEIELEDGTHKGVNFIKLTSKGLAYDHEVAIKEDIENAIRGNK